MHNSVENTPGLAQAGQLPLAGVKVVDLTRLAPGPYCTMLLADMGADVIVVGGGQGAPTVLTELARGKRFINLNLKSEEGQQALHRLVEGADVVIEGFRPGVADRLNAGYEQLSAINPGLVYCSLTGYGQNGPRSHEAGHDINYLSLSGFLGAVGPDDAPPTVPLNLVADFAGGSMVAAFGIASALYSKATTGKGRYLDVAMVDGCMSMMGMHYTIWGSSIMTDRGTGLLSGGAPFYRCYTCKDGKFVAVGALEPAFFKNLWDGLESGEAMPDHMNSDTWPAMEQLFEQTFLKKTREEWSEHFYGKDACVTPVLTPAEVWSDGHITARHPDSHARSVPVVPRLGADGTSARAVDMSDRTREVLTEIGLSADDIAQLARVELPTTAGGLEWPSK
jgi:alpha-methylacyl-CoA racemase